MTATQSFRWTNLKLNRFRRLTNETVPDIYASELLGRGAGESQTGSGVTWSPFNQMRQSLDHHALACSDQRIVSGPNQGQL
jgi:hypothetical protein